MKEDLANARFSKLEREAAMAIKDSGKRAQFDSGMVRDVTDDKVDYTLVMDGPMFERWAAHMTEGAKKYAKRNWMQANSEEEEERFKESALRHFIQWFRGDTDEDHAAAVYFNVNGAEYVCEEAIVGIVTSVGEGNGSVYDRYAEDLNLNFNSYYEGR